MLGKSFWFIFGLYISAINSQRSSGRIQWIGNFADGGNVQTNVRADANLFADAPVVAADLATTTTSSLTSPTAPQTTIPIGTIVSPAGNATTPRLELSKSLLSRILANIFGKLSDSPSTTPIPTTEVYRPMLTTPMTELNDQQIEKILLSLTSVKSTLLPPNQNSKTRLASRPRPVTSIGAERPRINPTYGSTTTTTTTTTTGDMLIPTLPDSTLEFIAQGLLNHPQGALPLSDASLSAKVDLNAPSQGVTELYPGVSSGHQSTTPNDIPPFRSSASTTESMSFERRILPPSILDTIARSLLGRRNTPITSTGDTKGTLNGKNVTIAPNPNIAIPLVDGSLSGNSGRNQLSSTTILDTTASSATTTPTNLILTTTLAPNEINRPTDLLSELTTAIVEVQSPSAGTGIFIPNEDQFVDTPLNVDPVSGQVFSSSQSPMTSPSAAPTSPRALEPSILELIAKGLLNRPSLSSSPDAKVQIAPTVFSTSEKPRSDLITNSTPSITSTKSIPITKTTSESSRVPSTFRTTPTPPPTKTTQGNVPTRTYPPTPVFLLPPELIKLGDPDKLAPANPTTTGYPLTATNAPGPSDSQQIEVNSEFGQASTTESTQLTDENSDPGPTLPHQLPKLRRPIPVEDSSHIQPKIIRTEATNLYPPVTESVLPVKSSASRGSCFGALLVTLPLHLWVILQLL